MQSTQRIAKRISASPARILSVSFLAAIIVGTILFMLPLSSASGEALSFVDAIFTATSAVCVTGLIVQDTASFFSPFGKSVLLLLIQIGGLGIMTISTSIALILRQEMSIASRQVMCDSLGQRSFEELSHLMRQIIRGTLLIELVGGLILSWCWRPATMLTDNWSESLALGFFHSISAFCNAGFSLFSDSMISVAGNGLAVATISILVISGGLGFIILGPLLAFRFPKGVHTRLALNTSLALLVGGTLFFFFNEYTHLFSNLSLLAKLKQAFFHAAMARTAGFNMIDVSAFSHASVMVLCFLMFIGASPGSTGGGIKTTTLAVMVHSIRALLRGRQEVEIASRRLPADIILRSITIAVLAMTLVLFFASALMITEDAPFRVVLFETFSAFGTVGLTLGLTPDLTIPGKFFITTLMYLGRIGPVTLALVLSGQKRSGHYSYPEGRVMVG